MYRKSVSTKLSANIQNRGAAIVGVGRNGPGSASRAAICTMHELEGYDDLLRAERGCGIEPARPALKNRHRGSPGADHRAHGQCIGRSARKLLGRGDERLSVQAVRARATPRSDQSFGRRQEGGGRITSPQTTRCHEPCVSGIAAGHRGDRRVATSRRRRVMFNGVQWQLHCRPGIVLNASARRCHELT
jgi:hypothetical protein